MDSFMRMVYFAYELKINMDDLVVIDIEKYPEIKEIYDSKGEGKYFLFTKDHYYLNFNKNKIESEGSVQDIINKMLELKNEESLSINNSDGIGYNYSNA
jgi:hypothetical protein